MPCCMICIAAVTMPMGVAVQLWLMSRPVKTQKLVGLTVYSGHIQFCALRDTCTNECVEIPDAYPRSHVAHCVRHIPQSRQACIHDTTTQQYRSVSNLPGIKPRVRSGSTLCMQWKHRLGSPLLHAALDNPAQPPRPRQRHLRAVHRPLSGTLHVPSPHCSPTSRARQPTLDPHAHGHPCGAAGAAH